MADEKRRIKLRLTIDLEDEVPADWDDESARFYVDENHCLSNYILAEARRIEQDPKVCNVCTRAKATYLGPAERAAPAVDTPARATTAHERRPVVDLLRSELARAEHRTDGEGYRLCCSTHWSDPHETDCTLDAALTAAGLPDRASRDAARAVTR